MTDAHGKYDDIINLPHHVSTRHPRMSIEQRAAQFAPFAALSGYEQSVQEATRRVLEHGPDCESYSSIIDMP